MNDFTIEKHGDALVVAPAGTAESLEWQGVKQAAGLVLEPIQDADVPLVVFDLSALSYFGSVFLALLLQCHKIVKSRGGELVIAGVSDPARELLRITALDTLWAIYESRDEALDAIGS